MLFAVLFQSTLPRVSDPGSQQSEFGCRSDFNPRSLAGATPFRAEWLHQICISIHAPSRERRWLCSSGPHRSHFNPRSLAGATRSRRLGSTSQCISIHAPSRERPAFGDPTSAKVGISIHAPSRERHLKYLNQKEASVFQSTLPRGSDVCVSSITAPPWNISIHAPSRERPLLEQNGYIKFAFQSTLPRGSDGGYVQVVRIAPISIHAPSRERLNVPLSISNYCYFNPRSLAGATFPPFQAHSYVAHFNPRSLAGATSTVKQHIIC